MSESPRGDKSGREAYEALWHAHDAAHKHVYVLASHSHYYMDNIFETADWKDKVLPAGSSAQPALNAISYRPKLRPRNTPRPMFMATSIATVAPDGAASFQFQRLSLDDLHAINGSRIPEPLVRWCYENNHQ